MDTKKAKRALATGDSGYQRKEKRRVEPQKFARGNRDTVYSKNSREDSIIEAIDQREFLIEHADWIKRLRNGEIDAGQFIHGLAPDSAIALAELASSAGSEKVRLAAIQDMLDRAGYGKVQKIAAALVDPNAPKEQLISLIRGLASKSGAVEIIEDDDEDKT